MVQKLFFLLTLFGVLSVVLCQAITLQCYDCDPTDEKEKCIDPAKFQPQNINCNKELGVEPNSTLVCMSAYIKGNDITTGIYRGCRKQKSDVTDYCDFFKEEILDANFTLVSCKSCGESLCNNHTFRANGNISGANKIQDVILPLVLCAIFFLIV